MASFGEILANFKANDEVENIVAIITDTALQNGLIAWKSVSIRYKPASDCVEKNPAEQWNWMWDQVEFNSDKFGIVAGLKAQDVGRVLQRLKGLHLIYPDGTIDKMAKSYLQSIIMSKLRMAQGNAKKTTPPPQQQESKK